MSKNKSLVIGGIALATAGVLGVGYYLSTHSTQPTGTTTTATVSVDDQVTLAPVVGATVQLGTQSQTVGSSGVVTFSGVTIGASLTLAVAYTGYYTQTSTVTITDGFSAAIKLAAMPVTVTQTAVTVEVEDSTTLAAISGAVVTIGLLSATTNNNGSVTFASVPLGTATLGVSATGYNAGNQTVDITVNDSFIIDLTPVAVVNPTLGSLTITPTTFSVAAGGSQAFTITADSTTDAPMSNIALQLNESGVNSGISVPNTNASGVSTVTVTFPTAGSYSIAAVSGAITSNISTGTVTAPLAEVTFVGTPIFSGDNFRPVVQNNTSTAQSIQIVATVTVTSTGQTHNSGSGVVSIGANATVKDIAVNFAAWSGQGAFSGVANIESSTGTVIDSIDFTGTL